MKEFDQTVRQRIAETLKGGFFTARELSRALGIKEKEVIEHLPHVAKSTQRRGVDGGKVRFVVEPSECLDCGFVFKKRDRLNTPSKCPVCRSEGITEARYGIVEE